MAGPVVMATFVGGPADGRRIHVPRETHTYVVTHVKPRPSVFEMKDAKELFLPDQDVDLVTYRRRWRDELESDEVALFVVEGMDARTALRLLACGYGPAPRV